MARIQPKSIEALREKIDICDVVSQYVTLRRAGVYMRGLSPFNEEKTPSFFVHPERQIFKCFSSGHGGDVFSFIQLKEQMTFPEAVEFLAEKYNFPLEYEGEQDATEHSSSVSKSTLYRIHEKATAFFNEFLLSTHPHAHRAREYFVKERQFNLSIAEKYQIGLAPNDLNALLYAIGKGFSAEELVVSGLFFQGKEDPTRIFPRFRGRLMIPIRDTQGRVVGFTGRTLPGITQEKQADAKYVNSPETPIFHKGNLLFGLDSARQHIETEPFVMVEGQLDCLRCWESGILTAVAPQGTGITEHQLVLLRRYSPRLNVVLDGDEAGQNAAIRMIPLAFKAGLDVRFITLPEKQDPDSFLRNESLLAWRALQEKSQSPIQMLVASYLSPQKLNSLALRQAGLKEIFSVLMALESRVAENAALAELSFLTGIELRALKEDFRNFSKGNLVQNTPSTIKASPEKLSTAKELLLEIFLQTEALQLPMTEWISPEALDQDPSQASRLLNYLLGEVSNGTPVAEILPQCTPEDRDYLYGLMIREESMESPIKLVEECLQTLHKAKVTTALESLDRELKKVGNDLEKAEPLLRQRIQLRKALHELPHITPPEENDSKTD